MCGCSLPPFHLYLQHIGGTPLNPYENPANPLNQAHMAQSGLLNTNQIMFNNSAMAVGQPSVQVLFSFTELRC